MNWGTILRPGKGADNSFATVEVRPSGKLTVKFRLFAERIFDGSSQPVWGGTTKSQLKTPLPVGAASRHWSGKPEGSLFRKWVKKFN